MKPKAYLVFHLNLAFSSISEEARPTVVECCYWPLLKLVETSGIPIGVELTGWTLEKIKAIDPEWVGHFRQLLAAGRCELIGSGYAQIIGPLVPSTVNRWNQRLGLEVYSRELGVKPRIAFVNEMAYSGSMVDMYKNASYEGLMMDRDNVRLALAMESHPVTSMPTHGVGPAGAELPILWADSFLFQKLQQFVHGDIRQADYLDYLQRRIASGEALLPLYANDAEIFDFRPGRFSVESPTHKAGEWRRLQGLLAVLVQETSLQWCSPSEALSIVDRPDVRKPSVLTSAAQPIPVKKQAKYNIGRWAVTGRNSTWINTMCHRIARHLDSLPLEEQGPDLWRKLCSLWASDLRTHITLQRWDAACVQLDEFAAELGIPTCFGMESPSGIDSPAPQGGPHAGYTISRDAEDIHLTVETQAIRLVLNLRRGLSIHSLAFRSQAFVPLAGTLAHGYFNAIALGADFYSGGVVIELPSQHSRITDLERVEPELTWVGEELYLRAVIPSRLGSIVKIVRVPVRSEFVELEIGFPGWDKPHGRIHVGNITLLPEAFNGPLTLSCANGGDLPETFPLKGSIDHSAPSASLVSSTTGFGATDGRIEIGDEHRRLVISWNPSECAALPMLVHKQCQPFPLTRLFFSMLEFDDTSKPGGQLGSLTLRLGAAGTSVIG